MTDRTSARQPTVADPGAPRDAAGTEPLDAGPMPRPQPMRDVTLRHRPAWWAILAIYAALFLTTGYIAFEARDSNPALDAALGHAAAVPADVDADTRAVVLDMLQQEAHEHNKRESLALQSFNVVLGSLLGFLAASAVSRDPH